MPDLVFTEIGPPDGGGRADPKAALADSVTRAHAALRRQWEREPPPQEPVEGWRIEFAATKTVAESVMKFAKLSGVGEGHYRRISLRGG